MQHEVGHVHDVVDGPQPYGLQADFQPLWAISHPHSRNTHSRVKRARFWRLDTNIFCINSLLPIGRNIQLLQRCLEQRRQFAGHSSVAEQVRAVRSDLHF